MLSEEFQDSCHGGHLGYLNGTILAILNLCVTDASHQVLAQFDLQFGRMSSEEFQAGCHGRHLGSFEELTPPSGSYSHAHVNFLRQTLY